ncbi:hypothetical protein ABID37_002100 [Aquamicrobium terrae]|uniref:Uncharacterized protein n=1 Tax=Aquamicrobium terrae TaxID=1324945 RepID=A0ABV2MYL4_9HYPH
MGGIMRSFRRLDRHVRFRGERKVCLDVRDEGAFLPFGPQLSHD